MYKRSVLLIVLVLIAPMAGAFPRVKAEARTIVVPDDCSTISLAVEKAMSGDTIFVKAGTYTERIVIDKALSLRGENKETTIINGDNGGTVILVRHDNVEVTGFSVIYDETANSPVPYWMWSTRLIGVHLLSASHCNIWGNKISDCGAGIWLYDAHENQVADNSICRCDYGIRTENSQGNTMAGNSVYSNWGGLSLLSSTANKLRNNVLSGNVRNFAVAGSETAAYVNDVDTSNSVNGKPIYYWIALADQTVPSDAGCVVLMNCRNITVRDLSLSKVQDAILLVHCWNSIVTGNTITECNSGVRLLNSTYDNIFGNSIESSIGVNAVANGTRVHDNVVKSGGTGILAEGNYNTIAGNTVDAGTIGAGDKIIRCQGSYNNISQNTLNGQTYVGVLLEGSHNLFVENTVKYGGLRVQGDTNLIAKNKIVYESINVMGGPENVICGNTILNGYDLGVSGQHDTYYANHVETNGLGARIGGTEANVHDNLLFHNNFIISTRTGPVWGVNRANSWDNGSEGNYWSDYAGTDANADGIGDAPYSIMSETLDETIRAAVPVEIGQDHYPLMAPYDISAVNPELSPLEIPQWTYEEVSSSPNPEEPIIEPSSPPKEEPTPSSKEPDVNQEPEAEPNENGAFPPAGIIIVVGMIMVGAGSLIYRTGRRGRTR